MKTTDWFKHSIVFSEKYRKAWRLLGVIIFLGCLGLTIYDWIQPPGLVLLNLPSHRQARPHDKRFALFLADSRLVAGRDRALIRKMKDYEIREEVRKS